MSLMLSSALKVLTDLEKLLDGGEDPSLLYNLPEPELELKVLHIDPKKTSPKQCIHVIIHTMHMMYMCISMHPITHLYTTHNFSEGTLETINPT